METTALSVEQIEERQRLQGELERIDAEWTERRKDLLTKRRDGELVEPSEMGFWIFGLAMLTFAVLLLFDPRSGIGARIGGACLAVGGPSLILVGRRAVADAIARYRRELAAHQARRASAAAALARLVP